MRKKNLLEQYKNKKSKKVVTNIIEYFKDNININYLVFSKVQLDKIHNNIKERLQNMCLRAQQPSNYQSIESDPVIKQLQEIQKQAKCYDFLDVQKNIVLTLGKRILNLEIQNRRWQTQQRKIKKEQIEQSFFRHKKIKKFHYQSLIQNKFKQNSYIVRPYGSGKGFIESDISYRDLDDLHVDRLQECCFLDVIKQVNKIYMNNCSMGAYSNNFQTNNSIYIKISLVFCFLLLIFGTMILSCNIANIQYFIIANVILIMLQFCLIGIKNYFQKPNHNNQLQQTKCDVKAYFIKINGINLQKGRRFTWICPDNFMYLEVHFDE